MSIELKRTFRATLNRQVKPSLIAIRTRGDFSVLSEVVRGICGLRYQARDNVNHLQRAMDWLCVAQDATPDGGVSAFYDVATGQWAPSYPETTGYISSTFFDYAAYSGNGIYKDRALKMVNWLLSLQMACGAFPMGPLWEDLKREPKPIVFDTGQIMHGLMSAFEETDAPPYLNAAKRAADWLGEIQSEDGSWREFTFLNRVHTYNARVAWAMLRIFKATQEEKYRLAALRNLNWVVKQQRADGWFENAAFSADEAPLTHTLAYTIRGLLEAGILLSAADLIDAATKAASAMLRRQETNGFLQGTYGPDWQSDIDWCCLTGAVQMAIIWFKLFSLTGDVDYLRAARAANHYVKQVQGYCPNQPGIHGGVAGSFPIYGGYHPYLYVNWAAKFLVDSLLLESQITQ